MDTKLTEQQSLALINEMINRARHNVRKGAASSIILNGYAVAGIAIVNFLLLRLLPAEALNYSFFIWCLMIPVGVLDRYVDRRVDKQSLVKTEIDYIISSAWRGFVVSIVGLLIAIFTIGFFFRAWQVFFLITPTIMLMVAIAEFVMAKACRFKPFFLGAVSFWTGAMLCLALFFLPELSPLMGRDWQFIILAACMIAGFIIPGYKLNKLAEHSHV
jgi:uncharacterized membrane protein